MPLYEYQCQSCAHRFELIRRYADPPVEACPACGGSVRKLLSSPAIQFKGSGWYITDYARKGESKETAASSESKTETKADTKAETKTETKTETKADSKAD